LFELFIYLLLLIGNSKGMAHLKISCSDNMQKLFQNGPQFYEPNSWRECNIYEVMAINNIACGIFIYIQQC